MVPSIFLIATILSAVVGLIAFVVANSTGTRVWAGITVTFGCVLIVCDVFWLCWFTNDWKYSYDTRKCDRLATQVDRDTKMARYTHWSWECLVNVDGEWIPKNQWYINSGPGR